MRQCSCIAERLGEVEARDVQFPIVEVRRGPYTRTTARATRPRITPHEAHAQAITKSPAVMIPSYSITTHCNHKQFTQRQIPAVRRQANDTHSVTHTQCTAETLLSDQSNRMHMYGLLTP